MVSLLAMFLYKLDGNVYPTCRKVERGFSEDVRGLSIGFETQESAPLCLNRDEDRLTFSLFFSLHSSILVRVHLQILLRFDLQMRTVSFFSLQSQLSSKFVHAIS
ncbi:hypothetical protein VNO78_01086 [Psophocarpus tetragonolobus]|uniref:Uncharacterized protein n=1 Tax=Psophocarpus tetragonolobus TaxID=3891 RepID=A0AAN9T187_PSOTE